MDGDLSIAGRVETCVGRQAIFDRNVSVVGYELLFRPAPEASQSGRDDSNASYEVIQGAMLDIGLERILNGRFGLLNLTRELILDPRLRALPKDLLKLEILENVVAEDAVIEACRDLKRSGYTLILDDYTGQPGAEPFLDLVEWVKVDFRMLGRESTVDLARRLSRRGLSLLAEKVETQDEFDAARNAGYEYFQGFFLQRPNVVSGRTISLAQIQRIRLLAMLAEREIDLRKLSRAVSLDAGLSFQILRYANSARFGTRRRFSTLHEALIWIGGEESRRMLTLATLPRISCNQSPELLKYALVRARVCEELAKRTGNSDKQEKAFLTGLFSLLDAMLGVPMKTVVEELNLAEDLSEALLNDGAPRSYLGRVLNVVKSYETASWDDLAGSVSVLQLRSADLVRIYVDATEWAAADG